MNIAIIGLPNFPTNKVKIPDKRLKVLQQMFKSKEIVPASVFFLGKDRMKDCEGIICSNAARFDIIVEDMDFIDRKLSDGAGADQELFEKAMSALEAEMFLYEAFEDGQIDEAGLNRLKEYPLYTTRPSLILEEDADINSLPEFWWHKFGRAIFFTAGTKDSHAWMFRIGQTAVECAGIIHSDIARGFVRAEIVPYDVLVEMGSLSAVRQAGKLRLEGKDYKMQEGDWALFRTTG